MENLITIIMIALFIEAIVEALKPLWSKNPESRMSVSELVSIGVGVFIAVVCKLNLLDLVVAFTYPAWMAYVFYGMTGVAIGRGTNFLFDLWERMKRIQEFEVATTYEEDIELDVEKWSLEQLKGFCELNGVPATGCETREEYIDAIMQAFRVDDPPEHAAE